MSSTSRPFTHQAFAYSSTDEFVAGMAPFVHEGRRAGDPVLAVTSRENVDSLREELGGVAADVEFRYADEWYRQPCRTLEAYDRYVKRHANGHTVRVIGEPVWSGLSAAEIREWTRYESVLNVAFASSPAWIVCPYNASLLPERVVEHAACTHPELIRKGAVRPSPAFQDPRQFVEDLSAGERDAARRLGRTLEFDGSDYGAVRAFVVREGMRAGLSADRLEELVLVATELTTNAARHGRPPVVVRMWRDSGELVCEVEDAGEGFTEILSGYLSPSPLSLSGRGLWIVRRLCECVDVLRSEGRFAVRVRMAGEPRTGVT